MNKFPKQAGDVCVRTGRVAVRVDAFANSDLNGDAPAYLFKQEAEEWGMDPWRLIEGVDPSVSGGSFDIWGAAEWSKKVGPAFLIFVSKQHADQLALAA